MLAHDASTPHRQTQNCVANTQLHSHVLKKSYHQDKFSG